MELKVYLFIYLFFMLWSYKLVLHDYKYLNSTHGTQKSTKQYQKSNRYQIVEKDNDH